jgi:hypothetical protein
MRLASNHHLNRRVLGAFIPKRRFLTKSRCTGPNPPTTPRKRSLRQVRSSQARQAADRSRAHHGEEEGEQSRRAEVTREQSVVV